LSSSVFFLPSQFSSFSICLYFFLFIPWCCSSLVSSYIVGPGKPWSRRGRCCCLPMVHYREDRLMEV
jgi:hypothetical protein